MGTERNFYPCFAEIHTANLENSDFEEIDTENSKNSDFEDTNVANISSPSKHDWLKCRDTLLKDIETEVNQFSSIKTEKQMNGNHSGVNICFYAQ